MIFGYQEKQLKVLVSELNFTGEFLALPGGYIGQREDIGTAANRILLERTCTRIYTVKGGRQLDDSIQSKAIAMVFVVASEIERT